jgi:hypothetical protein
MDATATALKVAGALAPLRSAKAEATFDGINLLPMLTGAGTGMTYRSLFWRVDRKNALRRDESLKSGAKHSRRTQSSI